MSDDLLLKRRFQMLQGRLQYLRSNVNFYLDFYAKEELRVYPMEYMELEKTIFDAIAKIDEALDQAFESIGGFTDRMDAGNPHITGKDEL